MLINLIGSFRSKSAEYFCLSTYNSVYSKSFRIVDREPYAVYREPNKV